MAENRIDYRLGSLYALVTAGLYAVQEPFSFLAAKRLNTLQFVCLTQIALAISIPLLTLNPASRRSFVALLRDRSNYGRLAVIFAIGMSGLILYNMGLSNAHPIIVSTILNLLPFWAALVALFIARVPIPVSPAVFFLLLRRGVSWAQWRSPGASLAAPTGRWRALWKTSSAGRGSTRSRCRSAPRLAAR